MTKLARRSPKEAALARANALQHILADVAEQDAEIVHAANLARRLRSVADGERLLNLGDDELKKEGWTREELQIATDARHCAKEAPVFLAMAQRRIEVRSRIPAESKPAFNVQIVVPTPTYRSQEERDRAPVIDVSAMGEKP